MLYLVSFYISLHWLYIFPLFMCSSFIAIQSIGVFFAWLGMLKDVPDAERLR